MSPESATEMYEACRPWQSDLLHAVGLDSNAYNRPPFLLACIFRKAREDGLIVTSYCDAHQDDTHEHISQCLWILCNGKGLDKIDHDLNAMDRPELLENFIKKTGWVDLMLTIVHVRHRNHSTNSKAVRCRYRDITDSDYHPPYMHNMWAVENLKLVKQHCKFAYQE
jgi:adenosine deaminase